ncbi:MAG TPA: hypothetical protein VN903_11055 [Polyangia bacterium]|jgi:WD40 repeat protein|nr:hypothetical protein [Polyangia bacterium]
MKFETDSAIRSPGRSRRLASAAIALVVSGAACSADNLLGLDDGSGAVNAGANVEAFDMSGGSNCDQLAVAGGSTEQINQTWIKMVAPQDGATVRAFKPPMQTGGKVRQAKNVVAVADGNTTVWLLRPDGTVLRSISHDFWVSAMALSADGSVLITGTIGPNPNWVSPPGAVGWTVFRFDVATGAEIMPRIASIQKDDASAPWITSVAISPDGTTIAAGGASGVQIWRASDAALLAEIPTPTEEVALSGTELAVPGQEAVTFYSLAGERVGQFWAGWGQRVVYSADGTKLALFTSTDPNGWDPDPSHFHFLVKVINRPDGTELATYVDESHGRSVNGEKTPYTIGLAFVENDTAVAIGWSDRRVTKFGASDGKTIWSRVVDPGQPVSSP